MGLAASRIAVSGNHMLRRPKRSKNEVVAPKEEKETKLHIKEAIKITHQNNSVNNIIQVNEKFVK